MDLEIHIKRFGPTHFRREPGMGPLRAWVGPTGPTFLTTLYSRGHKMHPNVKRHIIPSGLVIFQRNDNMKDLAKWEKLRLCLSDSPCICSRIACAKYCRADRHLASSLVIFIQFQI